MTARHPRAGRQSGPVQLGGDIANQSLSVTEVTNRQMRFAISISSSVLLNDETGSPPARPASADGRHHIVVDDTRVRRARNRRPGARSRRAAAGPDGGAGA